MNRLRIDITPARLGLDIAPPHMRLKPTMPQIDLKTEQPAFDIDIDWPRVDLDLAAAHAEIGLMRPLEIGTTIRDMSKARVAAGTAQTARDGDELARIEVNDRSTITSQMAWPADEKEVNVDVVPKNRVGVRVSGGMEIDWHLGRVAGTLIHGQVQGTFRPGSVQSYLAQKPSIRVDVEESRHLVWA